MEGLASDTSGQFDGKAAGPGKVASGEGSETVWFDLYGRAFAVFNLHSLFALSVTLLVVTPILLIGLTALLIYVDRWYPFSSIKHLSDDDEPVRIDGFRAFFRTPVVYVIATAALVGLAFLVTKVNPYIVYSSEYSVWSMMLTAWVTIFWFLMRGANSMRPSALHRMYTLMWMYSVGWILLVAATVAANNFHLAGGYFVVIYFSAVFAALLISYFELLFLPSKTSYAELIAGYEVSNPGSPEPRPSTSGHDAAGDDDDINERTSLLRDDRHRTFGSGYGNHSRANNAGHDEESEEPEVYNRLPRPYRKEQAWSGKLLTSTWLLQFLILCPIPVILVGQIALLVTSALYQTPADGSPVLTVYLFFAILSVLLLAPITPFIHRLRLTIPAFLFAIFAGTLIYNLLAFPFSDQSRLKVYFVQSVNLDTGLNNVSLTGLSPYVRTIVDSIPSAAGQAPICTAPDYSARSGLTKCSWSGPPPNVLQTRKPIPPDYNYSQWVNFTVSQPTYSARTNSSSAQVQLYGLNTRTCRLLFDQPIEDFRVKDYATDSRFPSVGNKGCKSIRLWTRVWGGSWDVNLTWRGSGGLDGRVVCLWSDANDPETIPAYKEVLRYMPSWSIATKLSDGLVEGYKVFKL